MQTEDGQIIHECLNGNPAEFGLLVDKYKEGIYALAYSRLGNFHDAQDITQETFIKAYTKLRTLKYWDSFAMWLGAIANNLCRQLIRSRSRRPDRDFAEDNPPEIIDTISIKSYQDNSVYQSLNDALESLPETYRQVLVLHYFSGMKSMEIARMLGVSLRTVTERLKMGREKLREEMITMMGATFREQKLPAGFTIRIVESVKRIRIHPASTTTKGLPWGLSIATGIITTVMIINLATVRFNEVGTPIFAPLPAETKVLKVGEIPVDVFKASNMSMLSSNMGKGKGGEPRQPEMENAFFMAPHGEGGTWTKKADMPTARLDLRTCVVDGIIYAIGGSQNGPELSTVEAYDPETDTWTKKADMPTPRYGHSACVVNGLIYIIEGITVGPTSALAVEVYNPKDDTWIKKGGNLPPDILNFSACMINKTIYALTADGIMVYDLATDTWTEQKTPLLTVRGWVPTSVVNGKIYAIGGGAEWNVALNEGIVEEYTPEGWPFGISPRRKLPTEWGKMKS
jgi:RNA polymerase sigma factor (sigma-70 family)